METKVCKRCQQESNSFIDNRCRACVSAYSLENYHRNKHKKGIKNQLLLTKEEKDEKRRVYERNKYKKEREALGKTVKVKRKKSEIPQEVIKQEQREACKRYRERNIEKKRESARNWGMRNRDKMSAYLRERYNTNEQYNITSKLRGRFNSIVRKKGIVKNSSALEFIGCSYDFFKNHIESLFTEGMTWDLLLNGEVHLDHKIPCISFDLTKEEEQRKCFHYTNLQPLWAIDNLKKGVSLTFKK